MKSWPRLNLSLLLSMAIGTTVSFPNDEKSNQVIVTRALTDACGRPVAVEVYPGHTGDPSTVPQQVDKLRERFGLSRVVLAGDRGMLTPTQIENIQEEPR